MQDKLKRLKEKIARSADLFYAGGLLAWDQATKMPPGGVQARADQISTLQTLSHQFFVDEEVGQLLEDLSEHLDELDPDSDDARMIVVKRRDYLRDVRVPSELVGEIFGTAALAKQAWEEAKTNNDFAHFAPLLKKNVELQRQWAACFDADNPYDPLLDRYEPGLNTTIVEEVFSGLKPQLVDLVAAITENKDAVDGSALAQPVSREQQLALSHEVTEALGYEYSRGRLDESAHPFTTRFSMDDVRITTRIKNEPVDSLMSSIHEAGHAMHAQNISKTLYRTGLDYGRSMAVGESQSRFYENHLGRGRSFWRYWYPRLQEAYAPYFNDLDFEVFYRALNQSQPSLIRVEADEVTYGLHIMLRFELENDLINDRVKVDDLPAEWNARMEAYLGIVPPTDSEGVLQDIHWSSGYIGYFPDYLLGSIMAAQLWETLLKERPQITGEIEQGQYENVLGFCREKVMKHGRKYDFPTLIKLATGSPLKWEPYLSYLQEKFSEIYGL